MALKKTIYDVITSVDAEHVSYVSVLVRFVNGNEVSSHRGTFHLSNHNASFLIAKIIYYAMFWGLREEF